MAIKFFNSIEVDGEVQGTSLDINGNGDVSGILNIGDQVGINTAPASGVELHVNGEVRVDSTNGVATRLIRSNYFSSSSDIEVRSGSSGDIILGDGTSRLTLASDNTATFAGDVNLADSKKLQLGASQDLQIYHDGSNSYIVDAGTGDLLNYYSNDWKVIKYGTGELSIWATSDAGVKLYYDNAQKLETYAAGVGVTGSAYLTSGNHIHFDNGVTNNYYVRKNSSTLEFKTGGTYNFLSGNATFAETITWGGGKGILHYGSDRAILRADTILEIQTNGTSSPTAALTLDTSQNATFAGTVTANGTTLTGNTGTVTSVGTGNIHTLTASGTTAVTLTPNVGAVTNGGGNLATGDHIYDHVTSRISGLASTSYVDTAVSNLIDNAPENLNTLNELAEALNDDDDAIVTINTALAARLPLAGGTMTGNIAHASDFTLDVGGDIILDADGAEVILADGGTQFANLKHSSGDFEIKSLVQDKDIKFIGNDNNSDVTALTLDMSDAGAAYFNQWIYTASGGIGRDAHNTIDFSTDNHITFKTNNSTALQIDSNNSVKVVSGSLQISGDNANFVTLTESSSGDFTIDAPDDIRLDAGGGDVVLKAGGNEFGRLSNASGDLIIQSITSDADIRFQGNDGGTTITPLAFDISDSGAATFSGSVTAKDTTISTGATVSLANQPSLPLNVSNGGASVDGRVFINVKHDQINTASAVGAGLQMQAGAVTSGTASYFSSQIFLQSAGVGNHTIHSAPKGFKFYVDNHDTAAGSGTGYAALGDLALSINEDRSIDVATNLNVDGILEGDQLDINGNADISGNLTGVDNLTMSGNLTTGNGSIECGDLDVSGTITGDGSSVDSLNAGNISSGTLAVARGGTGLTSISTLLNSNVTSVSGNAGSVTNGVYTNTTQTISGAKTFSGNTIFSGAISQSNTTQSTNKSSGAYKTSGGVGIAKTLNVGEDVVAYASSDKRYKDNLQAITNPIDKVKSLTGYTFTWNDKHEQFNGNDDIGVVAQEVEKVFPEIVDTRDNGYKAVKYEKMVAVLIEAIKDQQKQIDELKEKCNGCSK